jgi:hypothetical protein
MDDTPDVRGRLVIATGLGVVAGSVLMGMGTETEHWWSVGAGAIIVGGSIAMYLTFVTKDPPREDPMIIEPTWDTLEEGEEELQLDGAAGKGPGVCPACGGALFYGRVNCPHCSASIFQDPDRPPPPEV